MYSLGATLYHMLTGKPPFACLDAGEIRAQQASPSLADPRLFRPDLPDEFVWLLEILLAHDPKDRFDDWNNLITILASFDFGKTVAQQKMIKSHSVMIRLPRSDIEKLTRHAKPQPVQGLHPTPPQPKSKHHWGIVLGIAVIFSTVLIILALFAIREDSKRLNCPQESLLPFQTTSQDDVNAALRTGPITETAKPSPGTTRFMALLIETRKFARQNPHKYEEILDRYEQLLAMAETNAPRWVPDLERQVRAIDLSMAAPLDDAEQAIRLRVRQFEDSGQYQAGIEWLEKYSGSFVNKTKRIRHSLANILKSRLDESSQGK